MPLSSNPNATAQFWLACDAEIPLKDRPVFKVRFITEAQLQEHAELMKRAGEAEDGQESYKHLSSAIQLGVVGWERFTDAQGEAVAWDSSDLIALFQRARMTERELWELAHRYPSAVRVIGGDLPLSGSRAKLNTARSAENTAKAGTAARLAAV